MLKIIKNSAKLRSRWLILQTASRSSTQVALLKDYDDIPGPKPFPIVGNLLELKNFGNHFLRVILL